MCWRSSPDRERPMVRLKRSTAGLNICAGLLWGSVTSPTTSPGVCSSPVASDRFYTLNYDEPVIEAWRLEEGDSLLPVKYTEELKARAVELVIHAQADPNTTNGAINRVPPAPRPGKDTPRVWVRKH